MTTGEGNEAADKAPSEESSAKNAPARRRTKRRKGGLAHGDVEVGENAVGGRDKDAIDGPQIGQMKVGQGDGSAGKGKLKEKSARRVSAVRRAKRASSVSTKDSVATDATGDSKPDSDVGGGSAKTKRAKAATPRRRTTRKREARVPVGQESQVVPVGAKAVPRLLGRLRAEVGPALKQEFGYTTPMQIPTLRKVVLNIGLGEALENSKALEAASRDLASISGQRPVTTRARKSIAGFKIREGQAIGLTLTLRGRRMYEFMDRLINSALPRLRDFRGVSKDAFDGRGNYSLGIREQVIFPEIDYNSIDRLRGLQVVIVTTARTDAEGLRLLGLLGMPFAMGREALSQV